MQDAGPARSSVQEFLLSPNHRLFNLQPAGALVGKCKTLDQARAVVTFLDAASEKTLRSTVALTAARGRGKVLWPLSRLLFGHRTSVLCSVTEKIGDREDAAVPRSAHGCRPAWQRAPSMLHHAAPLLHLPAMHCCRLWL